MEKINDRVLRVSIVGPESTGKTTLAEWLALRYDTVYVPEYAREYIDGLDREYEYDDLLIMARAQWASENDHASNANKVLFCDTDLSVIKIWSEVRYGKLDPWIEDTWLRAHYDLHLLTAPDIPWEYDPQREHPGERENLWKLYELELRDRHVVRVRGDQEQRQKTACEAIDQVMMMHGKI